MKRVLLMILDGWGVGKHDHSDVIGSTPTPNITELASNNPRALLYTSGENVGLPDGQMGNSEVGHLNIGAGRVVYQDLVKINRACRDHSIAQHPNHPVSSIKLSSYLFYFLLFTFLNSQQS